VRDQGISSWAVEDAAVNQNQVKKIKTKVGGILALLVEFDQEYYIPQWIDTCQGDKQNA
jgi:hypothetical protein